MLETEQALEASDEQLVMRTLMTSASPKVRASAAGFLLDLMDSFSDSLEGAREKAEAAGEGDSKGAKRKSKSGKGRRGSASAGEAEAGGLMAVQLHARS